MDPAPPISVLYVDDEAALLDIGRVFLERSGGFSVDTALSAQDALEQMQKKLYDAIVSDYQMPEMDGIAFLKRVRASGEIPFILFTGKGREEVVIEAINNGADFYLQKGGDPKAQFAELAHKIRQAVSKRGAEEALRESEQRLHDIIDFLPDATFAIDITGKVIAWNRAIEEMTGVPAGQILGKGNYEYAIPFYNERRPILIDLVFTSDDEIIRRYYSIIKKEGNILIAETSLPKPLGKRSVLFGKASPLYDKKGHVVGAIESIRDITEQRRTEEAVRNAEEKFSKAFLSSPDMISISEIDTGTFLEVNDAAVRIVGYTREEMVGKSALALGIWCNPLDRAALLARLKQTGGVKEYEAQQRRKSGEVFSSAISAETVTIGTTQYMLSIIRDITERKKAETALRESEQRYRNVVEVQSEFISRFLPDGTHVFANDAYLNYFHKERAALIGTRFNPDIPPEDAPAVKKHFASLTPNHPVDIIEHRIVMPDGNVRWQRWSDRAIFDEHGQIIEYQSVGRDITDLKRVEGALRESEERFRVIFGAQQTGIMLVEARSHVIVDVNPYATSLIGLPREGIIGRICHSFICPALQGACPVENLGQVVDRSERVLLTAEGVSIPILKSVSKTTIGKREYLIESFQNISELKEAQDAFHESEATLRALINAPTDSVILLDAQGLILALNETAAGRFKRRTDELVGVLIDDILPEEVARTGPSLVAQVLEKRGMIRFEDERDGRYYDTVAYPILSESGNVHKIAIIARDITEKRQVEDALTKSESRLRGIIRVAPIGIGVVLNRVLVEVNDRICTMTGYTAEELIGQSARVLYPTQEDFEYVGREKYRQIEQKGSGIVETRWQRKDGSIIDILLSSTLLDQNDPSKGVTFTALDMTERKQAEHSLRESEEKYRLLAETSPEMIYVIDTGGHVIYLNSAAAGRFHSDPAAITGKHLRDLFPAPVAAQHLDGIRRVIVSKTAIHHEICEKFPTGTVWVDVRLSPVVDDTGTVVGVLGRSDDITGRKHADATLKATLDRLSSLESTINKGPAVAMTFQPVNGDISNIRMKMVSENVRIFGYDPEEFLAGEMEYEKIIHPHDIGWLLPAFTQAVRSGTDRGRYEFRIFTRAGEIRWMDTTLWVERTGDGTISQLQAVGVDITERKRAEEAVRESDEIRRSLLNASPDGICITDQEGMIIYASPRAIQLFGGSSEGEAIGTSVLDWIAPEDRKQAEQDMKNVLRGTVVGASTYRVQRRDTTSFVAEINASVLFGADKKPHGMVAIIRDISDRVAAQEALRLANTKLNLLSSITRHDVLNKVSIISGYVSLIKERLDHKKTPDYVRKIEEATHVIRNLLTFTRDYQTMGVSTPAWLDIGAVLEKVLSQFDLGTIIVRNRLQGISVCADPLLEKVMYTLVDNAMRHGEKISTIRAYAQEREGGIACIFEDDGVGVPAGLKEKIFEHGIGQGSGVGLFIAREILAVTEMTIEETGEPGAGARFEIFVPAGKFRKV